MIHALHRVTQLCCGRCSEGIIKRSSCWTFAVGINRWSQCVRPQLYPRLTLKSGERNSSVWKVKSYLEMKWRNPSICLFQVRNKRGEGLHSWHVKFIFSKFFYFLFYCQLSFLAYFLTTNTLKLAWFVIFTGKVLIYK